MSSLPAARAQANWDPTTSGPFFTGTAETQPPGSFFAETYVYDYYQSNPGIHSVVMPLRFNVGVIDGLDFNASVPYDHTLEKGPNGNWYQGGGVGDTQLWVKKELIKASGNLPTISTELILTLPSGNYAHLKPDLYDADQTGLGTTDVGVSVLARKRLEPFEFYGQLTYTTGSQTTVAPGYSTQNGTLFPQGGLITPGDTIFYSGAFEHILNEKWNAGYLMELYGGASTGHNLFVGPTGRAGWSFLWAAPELEIDFPRNVSWGAGVALPVYQENYLRTITPMFTVTYTYSGPEGHR